MTLSFAKPSIAPRELIAAWGRIITGSSPMLSIEITRECPLSCPGCYAYGDAHLGRGIKLSELIDLHGTELVDGVLRLVRRHKPLHVSLVGGEPLVRHRELSRILPQLAEQGIHALVVTSGIIPVPLDWMALPRLCVAVSVDGLPEHHDIRRKPATYERILRNIDRRSVNIHWVVTRPMLERVGYLEEYVKFWSARREVNRIWVSVYTPQVGETAPEILNQSERLALAEQLTTLSSSYRKLLFSQKLATAFLSPPVNPDECIFAKMSTNYSADFQTRVEPCVFGGAPDCSQCGCAASIGLHGIQATQLVGPVKIGHFIATSVGIGRFVNRLQSRKTSPRWDRTRIPPNADIRLVKIKSDF